MARLPAQRLGVPFADGDAFHSPADITKMPSGTPLDDTDRRPWLESVRRWLHQRDVAGTGAVVACSAFRRRYRDVL